MERFTEKYFTTIKCYETMVNGFQILYSLFYCFKNGDLACDFKIRICFQKFRKVS